MAEPLYHLGNVYLTTHNLQDLAWRLGKSLAGDCTPLEAVGAWLLTHRQPGTPEQAQALLDALDLHRDNFTLTEKDTHAAPPK